MQCWQVFSPSPLTEAFSLAMDAFFQPGTTLDGAGLVLFFSVFAHLGLSLSKKSC
jgi:hypothetical protein